MAFHGERMKMEELEDRLLLSLLGQQLFPSDNAWNQNIASAPVAANSAAIIAHIGGSSVRVHPDWGADSSANGDSPLYGIPYNVVHGNSTAKVNVIIDNYPGESDIVPVPIPANAVIEGDYQNGPNPNGGGYNANQRGDSHLIVWDEDNNIAYELFGVTRPSDPTLFPNTDGDELPHTDDMWHAAQETVWNMNTDEFRTLGETSADAAGLSILAGLVRPDEGLPVSQGGQGAIDHALRFTLPGGDISPQYIYPGSHMVSESAGSDKLPLGSRLRLANTPAIDSLIANMPPESRIVATAMQQYGLILADVGSAMFVTGTSAAMDANNNISLTWNLDDIFASNGLEALNAGDFQVVNLTPIVTGLSASSGGSGNSITITGQNFSGAGGRLTVFFGSTAASSVDVLSDTQVSVIVPSGSGTVDVTVQSGIDETDEVSDKSSANVNAPIYGYGVSATSAADQFTFTSSSIDSTWQLNGGGSWSDSSDWSAGIPTRAGDTANFATNLASPDTVTLDAARSVGILSFDSAEPFTIAAGSGGVLTMDNGTGAAQINLTGGSDIISAPLVLDSNTVVDIAAGDTLTVTGGISGAGTLTVTGGGKLSLGTGVNSITGLTILSGSSLGLASSELLISYSGSSPQMLVQSYISDGQLVSGFVNKNAGYGIGFADGADGVVSGLSAGEFEIEPALLGDINLDGTVNFQDLQILIGGFGDPGGWDRGNFNGHSTVDFNDVQMLLGNFGLTSSLSFSEITPAAARVVRGTPATAASGALFSDFPIVASWLQGPSEVLGDD